MGCGLLDDLVHLKHRLVDLFQTVGLFVGGGGDLRHQFPHLHGPFGHLGKRLIGP